MTTVFVAAAEAVGGPPLQHLDVNAQMPKSEYSELADRINHPQVRVGFNLAIGNRRAVGGNSKGLEHDARAIEMKSVADRDAGVDAPFMEDSGYSANALERSFTARLGNDRACRHALLNEIIAANATLCVLPVAAAPSSGYHEWRKPFFLQGEGVVKARLINRRWGPVILSRPHHHNRTRRTSLVG